MYFISSFCLNKLIKNTYILGEVDQMLAVSGWEVEWMEYNTMRYDILLIKIESHSEIHKRVDYNKIKYNEIILLKDLCLDGKWTCNKNRIKLVWGQKLELLYWALKPYLLMGMRSRRSKRLERLQSEWSCKERVEGSSLRGSSFSNLTNVSQIGIRLTWVIF